MALSGRVKGAKRTNRRLREPLLRRAVAVAARSARLVLACLAASALLYGGLRLYRYAFTAPYLAVRTIDVVGAARLGRDDVLKLSGIKAGENILALDAAAAEGRIKAEPWVAGARVRRRLPHTVSIEIRERRPIALVRLDGIYVMDSDGAVFKRLQREDALDLPLVSGIEPVDFRGAGRGAGAAGGGGNVAALLSLIGFLDGRRGFDIGRVSEIHVDKRFGLSLYTADEGVRLEVGTDSFEEKFASLERVMGSRGGRLAGIEAIDLNNPREVVVKFTTNVVKEGGDAHGQKG
jgi:cell division septal protein FtsQ